MGTIRVSAQRRIEAPAEAVYGVIADQSEHAHFLPEQFEDFRVETGGVGAGTVTTFKVNAGRRVRAYRMEISEPEPGRVLRESDTGSSLQTTFTVEPEGASACRVQIETTWQGAGGVGGFFERTFAPRVMQGIYADELERLNAYARERAGA